jgi:hypothetical protein
MEVQQVPLADLNKYDKNPRRGNVKLIAESLDTYGQYKPITVNKRDNQILAGNHTFQAAESLGWESIAVVYVDVDEKTAAKIVAIDNRSTDLSEYDNQILLDLLKDLPDLSGSGYDETDLDDLKALLEEAATPKLTGFGELQKGETGASGIIMAPTIEDYRARYTDKATRMLIADYPNDRFVWLMEKLAEYREINSLVANSDAIVHLVEQVFGEKAPE